MKITLRLFWALALLPLACCLASSAGPLPGEVACHSPALETATYSGTIDGDTIICGPEHIRLFGINAAELHSHKSDAFRAALRVSADLENASAVYLERDPAATTDKFGRSLAWVWYRPGTDGTRLINLSLELHTLGLAPLYGGRQNISHWYDRPLGIPPAGLPPPDPQPGDQPAQQFPHPHRAHLDLAPSP